MTPDRFDAINRQEHGLSLAFGDRIFEDHNHLIISSIREIDGEERFKVVVFSRKNYLRASSCGGRDASLHIGKKEQQR